MENKKMKRNNAIWILPIITIVIIMLLFALPQIILIDPKGHIADNNVLFKWNTIHSYSYYQLLVDENQEFSSPLIIETDKQQYEINNLSALQYYWKVIGYNTKTIAESNTESFSIDSVVAVEIAKEGVRNTGSVAILLDLFRKGVFTGRTILDINKILDVKNATEIEASQK